MKTTKQLLAVIMASLLITPILNTPAVYGASTDDISISNSEENNSINIPDSNLKNLILTTLDKNSDYEITADDLASITKLDYNTSNSETPADKKISSLEGLEHCTNLSYLSLGYNNISDLSPLSGLSNLKDLRLYNNNISDLSPLSNLTQLDNLNISSNKISDLNPIASLTNLTEVILNEENISDITPLKNLTNLIQISLCDNKVSDLSSLSGLTNLKYLYLNNNSITDISPVSSLTNLNNLFLNNNKITNISPLSKLSNLRLVYIRDQNISLDSITVSGNTSFTNPITTINGTPAYAYSLNTGKYDSKNNTISLKVSSDTNSTYKFYETNFGSAKGYYTGTVSRDIKFQPIEIPDENLRAAILKCLNKDSNYNLTKDDMESIKSFDSLCYLNGKHISSIEGLEYCTNLTDLDLFYNNISDLSPLTNLTKLNKLNLDSNNISDISPISNLVNLTELSLGSNEVRDLSLLSNFTNLTTLNLSYNGLNDITPLANLTKLQNLNLSHNSIFNVDTLSNLTKLKSLRLYNNRVSNLSPLKELFYLETLDLGFNNIADISSLESLNKLSYLNLSKQIVLLDDEFFNGPVSFVNPITDNHKDPVTSITNVKNGHYNSADNKIYSDSTARSSSVNYDFNKTITLGSASAEFSGTAIKRIFVNQN